MTAQPRLRVAVDANPLIGERTGIGHVTARLLEGLALRDDVEVTGYAVTRTGRRDLAGLLPSGILPATSWVPARIVHPLWTRISWPTIEHWTGPVDVVHSPNFIAPPARVPVIVSVHDLAFAHSPELCRPEAQRLVPLLRHALARGAIVHTGSDFVAAEIREFFDLPPERVARVYSGIATHAADGDAASGARSQGATATSSRSARSSRARTFRASYARSTVSPTTIPRCVWSSPAGTDGAPRPSTPRWPRHRSRRASVDSGTSPTAITPTCSPVRRCSRTRRSTRGSGTHRSRPWLRGSPWSRPPPDPCPRWSAMQRASCRRATTTRSPPRSHGCSPTTRCDTTSWRGAGAGAGLPVVGGHRRVRRPLPAGCRDAVRAQPSRARGSRSIPKPVRMAR